MVNRVNIKHDKDQHVSIATVSMLALLTFSIQLQPHRAARNAVFSAEGKMRYGVKWQH